MSIAVKSGLPSLGSTEGAVISADEVSVSEDGSATASVGEDLPRGKSAYEIAKENGFDGTEAEWLASLKGATGAAGANGKDGENGKTPYVGENGNWYIGANDTGKPSRGAKGDKGEPGATGAKGDKGDPGAKGDKGEPGSPGAKGDKGDKGDTGEAFTYSDFTAEQLAALKGAKGDKGEPGENGSPGAKGDKGDTGSSGAKGDKGEPGSPGAKGDKGDKGDTGATPNLTIGAVTTLGAGEDATASITGTAESPVLNLGIPKGAKGDKGEPGTGGGGTYYVELDGELPGYTLSEATPLADIVAAYNDGKALFCRGHIGGDFTIELPLFSAFSSSAIFIFSGSHCVDNTGALPENVMITIDVEESGVYCEYNEYLTQANMVASVSASSTDSEVPSAKAVYTFVTGKIGEIENGTY